MKTNPIVKIVQPEETPVPVEVIASAIVSISEGIQKLRAGPLTERALLLLITDASPMYATTSYGKHRVKREQVRAVLDGLAGLSAEFVKPKARRP